MISLFSFLLPFDNLKKLEKHSLATESGHKPIIGWGTIQLAAELSPSSYSIMISGDVHGPATNMGNYNSGVIAGTVTITLVQSNKSE